MPLLPYVELPWRLLEPVAVCIALLVAALAPAIATLPRRRGLAMAAVLALLIVPNLAHLAPGRTTDVDLAAWTPQQLAVRGFETTTMGEITPRWMVSVPPYNPTAAAVASGDAHVKQTMRTPFTWAGDVAAKAPSRLRMSIAYYPGWGARVDGQPVEVAQSGDGMIEVPVPAGDHQVSVNWGRSPLRRLGEILSLIALAALALVARTSRSVPAQAGKPVPPPH